MFVYPLYLCSFETNLCSAAVVEMFQVILSRGVPWIHKVNGEQSYNDQSNNTWQCVPYDYLGTVLCVGVKLFYVLCFGGL